MSVSLQRCVGESPGKHNHVEQSDTAEQDSWCQQVMAEPPGRQQQDHGKNKAGKPLIEDVFFKQDYHVGQTQVQVGHHGKREFDNQPSGSSQKSAYHWKGNVAHQLSQFEPSQDIKKQAYQYRCQANGHKYEPVKLFPGHFSTHSCRNGCRHQR